MLCGHLCSSGLLSSAKELGDGQAWEWSRWALDQAVDLLISSRYVIAMTGAGVSVESGIPPFRGPGGLWTKHGEPPMDVYQRFLADPKGYWEEHVEGAKRNRSGPGSGATQRWTLRHGRAGADRHLAPSDHAEHRQSASCRRPSKAGGDHGNAQLLRCIGCSRRFAKEAMAIALDDLPPAARPAMASSKPT